MDGDQVEELYFIRGYEEAEEGDYYWSQWGDYTLWSLRHGEGEWQDAEDLFTFAYWSHYWEYPPQPGGCAGALADPCRQEQRVRIGGTLVCPTAFGAGKMQCIERRESPGFKLLSPLNLWLSDDDRAMGM